MPDGLAKHGRTARLERVRRKDEYMADEGDALLESIVADWRRRVEARSEKYKAIFESPRYQAELARLGRMTSDFINTLKIAWFATSRAGDWADKSLFMRSIDDLGQSAITIRMTLQEGARNPARRELRYVIELAIKALFVDQQMPTSPLEHRLIYFDRKLDPASIAPVRQLNFRILAAPEAEKAVQKMLGAYSRASQYVHPSLRQIEERLEFVDKGIIP